MGHIFVLESRLKRQGHYRGNRARWRASGVQLATSERPDVIMMDLSLPVLDGWRRHAQLKAAQQTRHIPVSP